MDTLYQGQVMSKLNDLKMYIKESRKSRLFLSRLYRSAQNLINIGTVLFLTLGGGSFKGGVVDFESLICFDDERCLKLLQGVYIPLLISLASILYTLWNILGRYANSYLFKMYDLDQLQIEVVGYQKRLEEIYSRETFGESQEAQIGTIQSNLDEFLLSTSTLGILSRIILDEGVNSELSIHLNGVKDSLKTSGL
jgi:hypothetical protein